MVGNRLEVQEVLEEEGIREWSMIGLRRDHRPDGQTMMQAQTIAINFLEEKASESADKPVTNPPINKLNNHLLRVYFTTHLKSIYSSISYYLILP